MNRSIRDIFAEVPETYERINHILTFSLDIAWRKRMARMAVEIGGIRWLDVCTGTGETAATLCRFAKNGTTVFAADFSLPMISKAADKPEGNTIRFVLSDILNLPFPDETFDIITISFATRNINLNRKTLIQSFRELHRILTMGGHLTEGRIS